jgi:hypothetical protein
MDAIDEILPALQAKAAERGYDALSHAERVVLDVTEVEAQVNNGGFDQFFYNRSGDRAQESIAALEEIGAQETAALLKLACGRFPGKAPSAEWFVRQKQLLEDVADEAFDDLDARFFADPDGMSKRLVAYWGKHKPKR